MDNLATLMAAIVRLEGFGRPGVIPTRLNNPGDLMFAGQKNASPHPIKGADGHIRNYASFVTVQDGFNALEAQIRLDAGRGKTLAQFVAKYAPASDGNNEKGYLAFVMKALHCTDSTTTLTQLLHG